MIYLLYGEEKYDLYKFVDKIKSKFDKLKTGVNLFYITKENINELESIASTVTFFGQNKLIIIKDTNLKFDIKKLILNCDKEDIYLIIEDNIDKRTTEYKELSKSIDVKEFKHLNNKDMVSYMINTLKMYKLSISYDNAQYMADICGEDKSNNINELKKLVAFLNTGEIVSKDTIDKICVKTLNSKIFDMLDFAVNKDKHKAIDMLDELLKQKEPVIKISVMLYKQIKYLYMIKYLKGKNTKDINSILEIHPFAFGKLNKVSDKYNLEYLRMLIDKFDKYDSKTKIGEIDFEIGLKQIICMM
ncbi:MAG: DNA polymerase III subunit delta [Clostridia bacterium]|nr:DNA polymerase III subunit delta [Clostridia bacterium]MDD4386139.1 DNA polymerase III subunit delta [Clostridia bacterium]